MTGMFESKNKNEKLSFWSDAIKITIFSVYKQFFSCQMYLPMIL